MLNEEVIDINRIPYGNPEFSDIRERNKIYVDKTELIYKIAHQDSPIFFSRPRRFGKSLLVNTLHSLFENGLKYFYGLDIEKVWNDKIYQVVHLDFSIMGEKNSDELKRALGDIIIQEFNVKNKVHLYDQEGVRDPSIIINEILKTLANNSVVLLIDEYDSPLTRHLNENEELKNIIKVLNDFYSTIKQYTGKFRLIFITGVTRTSHVSIFSAFNNLLDISLDEEFNPILGFTQENLEKYFNNYIEKIAKDLDIGKDDIYQRLEQYYDGFQFSLNTKQTLYNPWSVLSFLRNYKKGFSNYWFESGGSSSLIMNYLKISDSFNLLKYKDRKIYKTKKELASRYEIDNIPIEILLFQAGYFTLRKESNQIARLVFPNTEVEDSMLDLYFSANNIKISRDVQAHFDTLSENIDQKNLSEIISIFNNILNDCVSILSRIFEDERSIRDIIYAALPQEFYIQKIKERETLKGFSDLELLTKKTHMVIEFKRTTNTRDAKASLAEAVSQLKNKKYGIGSFQNRKLYRVAMVISTNDKAILPEYCQEVL